MTPFRYAMLSVVGDIAIALSLFHFIGYVGIAPAPPAPPGSTRRYCFHPAQAGFLRFDDRLKRSFPRLLSSTSAWRRRSISGCSLWRDTLPMAR